MKKGFWKRLISLMLALLVVCSCIAMPISAANDKELDYDLLLDTDDASFSVSSWDGWTKQTIAGYSVVAYGSAANTTTKCSAVMALDNENKLGSVDSFTVSGDFWFDSFPSEIRTDSGTDYTPAQKPLSLISWIYQSKTDSTSRSYKAIRIDNEGYLYADDGVAVKTSYQLSKNAWNQISLTYRNDGICELRVNGSLPYEFSYTYLNSATQQSYAVRFFDNFYTFGAKMRNLSVRTAFSWDVLTDKSTDFKLDYKESKWTATTVSEEMEDGGTKDVNALSYGSKENSSTDCGNIWAYDNRNLFGAYDAVSVSADFYFDAFPSGKRSEGGVDYSPEDRPLSLISWVYHNPETGNYTYNGIRIDSAGVLYTGSNGSGMTDIKLEVEKWVNITCIFLPTGLCELKIDGTPILQFSTNTFSPKTLESHGVRIFDNYFNFGAKVKNIIVSSEHDYIAGASEELTADYIAIQTSKVQSGVFDLRMVSGLNSLDYDRVGYTVYHTKMVDGTPVTTEKQTGSQFIYKSLNTVDASGNIVSVPASDYGVKYFSAIELSGLSLPTSGDELLAIRPWTEKDGKRIYGTSKQLLLKSEQNAEGYPVVVNQIEQNEIELTASEDTYVGGKYNQADDVSVHGAETVLDVKYRSDPTNNYCRQSFIKFTFDEATKDMIANAASVQLQLYGAKFSASVLVDATVTAVASDWSESTLTRADVATDAAELTGAAAKEWSMTYGSESKSFLNVTDYLKSIITSVDAISFRIDANRDYNNSELPLWSKEYENGKYAPKLIIRSTDLVMEHELELEKSWNIGYEPWGYAEQLVAEWFDGGERDKLYANTYGYTVQEKLDNDSENGEYSVYNPMYSKSNGAWEVQTENAYVRTMKTLVGFQDTDATQYDEYGGILNSKIQGEANGFFHTETINGKTYIIDPIGNPYIMMGVNTVNRGSTTAQKKVSDEKYGKIDPELGVVENFYKAMASDLKTIFGMNAVVGAGDDGYSTLAANHMPYVVGGSGINGYMNSLGLCTSTGGSSTYLYNNTMNVFDPDYITAVNNSVKKLVEKHKDEPYLVGYTFDNEIPGGDDILIRYLGIDESVPVNAFSYATAWTWLQKATGNPNPTVTDATPERSQEFLAFVYNRYFKVIREALDTYDGNHMYLGSRSNTPTKNKEGYLRAMAQYVDVMTVNMYGDQDYASINTCIETIQKYSNKPFIVSEFGVRAWSDAKDIYGKPLGNHMGTACWLVESQENRANSYESYVLNLLESGQCLGWVLYRFRDNDQSLWVDDDGNYYALSSGTDALKKQYTNVTNMSDVVTEGEKTLTLYHKGETDTSNLNHNKGIYDNNMNVYTALATSMKNISTNLLGLMDYFQ